MFIRNSNFSDTHGDINLVGLKFHILFKMGIHFIPKPLYLYYKQHYFKYVIEIVFRIHILFSWLELRRHFPPAHPRNKWLIHHIPITNSLMQTISHSVVCMECDSRYWTHLTVNFIFVQLSICPAPHCFCVLPHQHLCFCYKHQPVC